MAEKENWCFEVCSNTIDVKERKLMKVKRLALRFVLLQMLVVCIVCMEGLGGIRESTSGILIFFIAGTNIFALIKNKLLFTPLVFPNVYLALFGLYELKLRLGMTEMSIEKKFVITTCMLIWVVICISSKAMFNRVPVYSDYRFSYPKLKRWLFVLSGISISMMLYEWYLAGGIPALQTNSELFRMQVSQSGITHTLAIMIKIVAVLIEAYWISGKSKKQPKSRAFIFLYLIALMMMWGTANRGEMLFIPVVGLIILWTKYPPKKRKVLMLSIAGLVVLAVYPAVRGYGMYGRSYFLQYAAVSKYPELGWFMPLYGTLAFNFEILNKLFITFPKAVPWGMGQYTILCRIPFLNIGEELWIVQNEVWNNGFYGALTSTYMGPWYADFGVIGCYLGTVIICSINVYLYKKLVRKKSFGALVLYAYLFYITLVGSYGDAFNFVTVCYTILIWFVMCQCEKKDKVIL